MINDEYRLNVISRAKGNSRNVAALGVGNKAAAMLMGLGIAAAVTGCTHTAAKRAKVNHALAEESRALTTAVVDTLQSQPAANRDAYAVTALAFAKQDQRVEGLPLKPFDVPALLAGMGLTNSILPLGGPPGVEAIAAAREEVAARFEKQEELISKRAATEAKLIDRGEKAEAARNERIARWTKFGAFGTTLIGGMIALFVFCPVALPICGHLLAWIVGKVPSMASGLGVVSVKAFDSVLRGIEKAKDAKNAAPPSGASSTLTTSQAAPTVPIANTLLKSGDSRRGQENWIDQLHNHLSREMDAAHKALVRSRKTKLA